MCIRDRTEVVLMYFSSPLFGNHYRSEHHVWKCCNIFRVEFLAVTVANVVCPDLFENCLIEEKLRTSATYFWAIRTYVQSYVEHVYFLFLLCLPRNKPVRNWELMAHCCLIWSSVLRDLIAISLTSFGFRFVRFLKVIKSGWLCHLRMWLSSLIWISAV